jgi:hypothetical protein
MLSPAARQLSFSSGSVPAFHLPVAAVEMLRLAADTDWLHKVTKEISKYWRLKRERRQTSEPLPRMAR